MTRKYVSPLTAKLTPDNWKDKVNLKDMSLEDVTNLLGDFKEMKKFATQMEGYFKEAAKAKLPEGETEYIGAYFEFELTDRERAGGLDKDRVITDMGEDWYFERCKDPTEYVELRLKRVAGD